MAINAQQMTSNTSSNLIAVDFALSPSTDQTSWLLLFGLFAFGFYLEGGKYAMEIWLRWVGLRQLKIMGWILWPIYYNNTVIWTANRYDPLIDFSSSIEFNLRKLFVRTYQGGRAKPMISWQKPADSASIFDSPSDTLVGQPLLNQKKLVSSKSPVDHSSGRFHVVMQGDRNLVAYGVNSTNADTDAYWSTNTITESDVTYTLVQDRVALFFEDGRFCGSNSFCKVTDEKTGCHCFPGFDFVHESHDFLGCYRRSNYEQLCRAEKSALSFSIVQMNSTTIGGHPYSVIPLSLQECSRSCSDDCRCEAALHISDICEKNKLPTMYAATTPNKSSTPNQHVTKGKKMLILILSISLGSFAVLCCLIAVFSFLILRVLEYKKIVDSGNFGLTEELTLRPFSYKELKRATNGFEEELGKGSFGAFYKGTLYRSKRVVAVKRLEKRLNEGEREFLTEMHVIGAADPRHLVACLEFMSNASLADLLFRSERCPDWNERMRIALETARGILYLHEECDTPIIHCDIKPQNILMNDFWAVKISDFRLAELLMPDQTRTFKVIRGTRGYMAPEWHKGTPISVKADVYSYGIILLEIIFCRRHMDVYSSTPEAIVLSSWA
ncbi:hypothetical protein ACJRO7_033479 [Eucalyptus globulus]|uniref:Protein kinase domain-containing protein n=1 Tax=Eucalyptus globulus TaxID=34317 RepID=A0ABD3JM88_EUCGL